MGEGHAPGDPRARDAGQPVPIPGGRLDLERVRVSEPPWRSRAPRRFVAGDTGPFWIMLLFAPDLGGDLHDEAELVPLLGRGEVVAFLGGGEPALRRQAQLVDAGVLRSLLDAAQDVVLALQLAALAR